MKKNNSIEKYIEENTTPSVFCKYCKKRLTTIASKARGYGLVCYNKHKKNIQKKHLIGD